MIVRFKFASSWQIEFSDATLHLYSFVQETATAVLLTKYAKASKDE